MKAVLVFLFLLAFVTCETLQEVKDRLSKNKNELDDVLNNCILNDEKASKELKSRVEKNKSREPKKKIPLIPLDKSKVVKADKDVVKRCRVKQFKYIKKQLRNATK